MFPLLFKSVFIFRFSVAFIYLLPGPSYFLSTLFLSPTFIFVFLIYLFLLLHPHFIAVICISGSVITNLHM